MMSPESHARHVLARYTKDVPGATPELSLLQRLIADEIQKAVSDDRERLREKMACDRRSPCAFKQASATSAVSSPAVLARRPGCG